MQRPLRLQPARFSTLQARRICLIKPSALGDVVQTLPVLAALRRRFPDAYLAWVVNSPIAPLLRPISLIDEVIEFHRSALRESGAGAMRTYWSLIDRLADRRFDLVIDLQGLLRSGLMALATRAPRRIGLSSAREGAGYFYTDLIHDGPKDSPAVERYWQVARAFGVGELPKEFPLSITPAERRWAREAVGALPRPILAIHASARWETKRWPAASFAAAAKAARPASIVLVGSSAEASLLEAMGRDHRGPLVDLTARTDLRQLAATLAEVDVLLSNDSGPAHLAAAAGVPTVTVFTCTSPSRAAPFGQESRVVATSVDCRASYLKCCDRLDCMRDLVPERVAPILIEALEDSAASREPRRAA